MAWVNKEATTEWGEPCLRVAQPIANGRWQAVVDFVLREGRPVVSALTVQVPRTGGRRKGDPLVEPSDWLKGELKRSLPRGGLTANDLASLGLRRGVNGKALQEFARRLLDEGGIDLLERLEDEPAELADGPQRGKALTDAQLAEIAEMFIDKLLTGQRNVLVQMADEYARRGATGITREIVSDRVRLARDKGWLTRPGKKGVLPQGAPGPALIKWRKQHGRQGHIIDQGKEKGR